MSRTTVRSLDVLSLLFFICRDHSTPPLLGSKHGMRSAGFRCSYADNLEVLARGANCTNAHLARLIAGVQKACLDVHDTSLASGSADVLGCELSPANSYCTGTGKRTVRIRSVARTVSSRRSHQRSGGGARQWSRVFLGAQQIVVSSQSLTPSFKFAQASCLVSGEPRSTVRLEQRAFDGNSMSLPQ